MVTLKLRGMLIGFDITKRRVAESPVKSYQYTICPFFIRPSKTAVPRELNPYICTTTPDSNTKRAIPV
jgi:hypothetical protein